MELAGEIQDEFLTCNICLEGYTKPKQLPCLHTFCQKCLSQYIVQTVGLAGLSVSCPICRRTCLPPHPDPKKLQQWADQFPDNFFVASLSETVEARKRGRVGASEGEREGREGEVADEDPASQSTRYFMGKANNCRKHLIQPMAQFCLSVNMGVCELCLAQDVHRNCEDRHHLDYEAARLHAMEQLGNYRQQMEQVKQDIVSIKHSFGRKPRMLQTKREEVEISISDYFSDLRSRCAKQLLSRERELIETLAKITGDESQKTSDSQKECDNIMSSVGNTMTLFDTLTDSGPFNAMHVLATAEEQIGNFTKLMTKMDGEAKAAAILFQPPSENLEEYLSKMDFGEVVASFGHDLGEVIADSGQDLGENVASDIVADTGQRQNDVHDSCASGRTEAVHMSNLESQTSQLNINDTPNPDAVWTGNITTDLHIPSAAEGSCPSAPPLDDSSPPPYSGITSTSSDLSSAPQPSAPPVSDLNTTAMAGQSLSDRLAASPNLMAAYQKTLQKTYSCRPMMVFSGNLPNESRRGGLCGAAKLSHLNRAAFVDRHNHSVKIIDLHQAQIVGFVRLEMEPWDITFIKASEELLVTCPGARCLLFIPTNTKRLEIARHAFTSVGYCCIAHLKEEEFVGAVCPPFGPPVVHVVNMGGQILRQILTGHCTYPRTIFCDPDGTLVVVSDWTANAVFLASSGGDLVDVYRDASSPKGVAISELTNMLHVLDGKWSRLHLLSTSGQCLGTGKIEGCRDPRMVVVVSTSSSYFPDTELTVVADGNNALHVMSLSTDSHMSDDSYQYSPMSEV